VDAVDGFAELMESGRVGGRLAELAGEFATMAGDTPLVRESLRGTLSTYLDHPEWTERFERALAEPEPPAALARAAAELIDGGADRAELCTWLNGYHLDLVSQSRGTEDDTVLDLLDAL
jgi:hypothetical protein